MPDETDFLRRMFQAAIAAADPRLVLPPALPPKPSGRCVVVGAGKAAALMAQVVDQVWADVPLSGVVVTRYGHAVPVPRITVREAGHPVPDANSVSAAREILAAVAGLGPNDLVLCLISGGGSALMALPVPGLTLADKQALTRELLASGAPISAINTVRRAYSAIKGGKLAAAAGQAAVVTLAISDVPGDDPAIIASGPTVKPAPAEEAASILARYGVSAPRLGQASPRQDGAQGPRHYELVATPALSLAAAARAAEAAGLTALILSDRLEGESRVLGRNLAALALSCRRQSRPTVLLCGGETTVTLGSAHLGRAHPGRGGRNTEFLLALALHLDGAPHITALAGDTDGIDGTEDAAGAINTPTTLERARAAGLDPLEMLNRHDSYSLFAALGDLIVTGPTLTNVNDFRAILIT